MASEAWKYLLRLEAREIELADGEVTIGRSRSATVRIDHESVSRTHALMTLDNGNALLKDLNSSNGTFVGGRRVIGETRLSDGDRIQLGAALIEFRRIPPDHSPERTRQIDPPVEASPPPATRMVPVEVSADAIAPVTDGSEHKEEISASELFRDIDRKVREAGGGGAAGAASVAAVAPADAVEAVRTAVAGTEALSQGRLPSPPVVPEEPDPPPPPPASAWHEAEHSLSEVPIDLGPAREPSFPVNARPEESAGVGSRLLAFVADGVILSALDLILSSPVLLFLYFRAGVEAREPGLDWPLKGLLGLCGAMILGVNVLYTVGSWAKSGRTPGKSLAGVRVVLEEDPRRRGIGYRAALVRVAFLWLGLVPLGAGLLPALFRRDRRAWHDLVAKTRVVG